MNWTRFHRRGLFGLVMVVLLAGVVGAACSSDDKDATSTPEAVATQSPAASAASKITIESAWAKPSANNVGAAYLIIKNEGTQDDRLLSATSTVSPKVQVHEVVTTGMTQKMQELPDGLMVPAGASVELKPGGYHIMMMELVNPLAAGDTVSLTLKFEQAGSIDVQAPVKAVDQDMPGGSPSMMPSRSIQ